MKLFNNILSTSISLKTRAERRREMIILLILSLCCLAVPFIFLNCTNIPSELIAKYGQTDFIRFCCILFIQTMTIVGLLLIAAYQRTEVPAETLSEAVALIKEVKNEDLANTLLEVFSSSKIYTIGDHRALKQRYLEIKDELKNKKIKSDAESDLRFMTRGSSVQSKN